MRKFSAEKLLLLLVILTIAALLFRESLLKKRLVIDGSNTDVRFELDSDVQDGGNTKVQWLDKDALEWQCDLGEVYQFRFCGMQMYFSDSYMDGIDLTNYTHVNIWLNYRGDAQSYRVFFRNSNPSYTVADEIRTTKFNFAKLDISDGPLYNGVQLKHFRVADWWLQLYPLRMEDTPIDFTNIGLIEIQSGAGLAPGVHRFQLDKFEIVGVHISVEQMYFGIIVIWICAVLLYLGARIRSLKIAILTSKKKQNELTEINAVLDQRSKTLEELSKKDPLTGAYNRAGMKESLSEAFHQWRRNNRPLSILLFDVDHFKKINDTKGHAVGDRILRELTILVSESIRGEDRFARWGGEEFIVVCANTGLEAAEQLAQKLCKKIAMSSFSEDLRVTVSFGVAAIESGENLEALFNRTDLALYEAKAQGRNQVRVAREKLLDV